MKNFLPIVLALSTLLYCNSTHAQVAPSIEWQKSLGGSGGDAAYSIQQTTDGGFIVAGYSYSNNGDVSGNHVDSDGNNSTDYWIVKLDPFGNLVWQKSLGGSASDYAYSIQQTTDLGFIVAGWTTSNDGDVSGNHHSKNEYWIVKLDTAGNLVWQTRLGGSSGDYAYSIRQTSDSGFIVAGKSDSYNGDVTVQHGHDDYWIVKLNAIGNLVWQKSLGGDGNDIPNSIQQTTDGGFIVAGSSSSTDDDVSGNHGSNDYWIVKLDTNGNLVWEKSLGGSGNDEAYSIQQTTDGGFIIAGNSRSTDGDVSGNHGGYYGDYWIVKLDAAGDLLWQKCYGGSSDDIANSIQQTTDGGFIVAGYSGSNDGDVSGNHIGDYWIVKLDADGNIIWQQCYGGSSGEEAYAIQQTTDGGYIIAGFATSSDGDVGTNHGGSDYWIVKLSTDTMTGIAPASNSFISLYPNPAETRVFINLTAPGNEVSICVHNLQGEVITLPTTFENTHAQLNTTSLADGFYTVQITSNKTGKTEVGKFVKQ